MKHLIIVLIVAAFIFGLAWLAPHSPFIISLTTPTPAFTAVELASPTAIPENPSASEDIPVSYAGVSFTIPAGLASGADAATGPAIQAQPGFYNASDAPAFSQITLKNYPFPSPSGYPQPEVRIYPASKYGQVSSWAAESLKRLQNVLANPSAPQTNDSLPNVAYMGSTAQVYAAQVKQLSFINGGGVRMISTYAQYPTPVSRNTSFYHFEGLTRDAKYYVVVTLPVTLPIYADASNLGENGITYDQQEWSKMGPYYQAITSLLNASSPEGFNPMLPQLDLLVQSISVAPTDLTQNADGLANPATTVAVQDNPQAVTPPILPSPSASARDFIPPEGTVTGNLSFPSSFIPAMRIAFFNIANGGVSYTDTGMNQGTFTINLPAGRYHVIAYPYSSGAPAAGSPIEGAAGGYTQFVLCGLSADCKDHTLIPVVVTAGQTIMVNPGDWYAPEGTFPPMPTP